MATSSIFESFTINDKESAKKFADALVEAEKKPKWEPSASTPTLLEDSEKIKMMLAKRKQNGK